MRFIIAAIVLLGTAPVVSQAALAQPGSAGAVVNESADPAYLDLVGAIIEGTDQ